MEAETDKQPLSKVDFQSLVHHVEFGRGGRASAHRVIAQEGWMKPFERAQSAPWEASIPASDLGKLINGFQPREMEDKWLIFSEGPNAGGKLTVNFVRSWTGFQMFELSVKVDIDEHGQPKPDADAEVMEIAWETESTRTGLASEEYAKESTQEVCRWVMDVNLTVAEE